MMRPDVGMDLRQFDGAGSILDARARDKRQKQHQQSTRGQIVQSRPATLAQRQRKSSRHAPSSSE
jgi:hypothetical protein